MDEIEHPEGLRWERPYFYDGESVFHPQIFDSQIFEDENSFNTVRIVLDGRLRSSLDWAEAKTAAQRALDKGLKILWEIDLGLTSLHYPYSNLMQQQTLSLALENFRDSLWPLFRPQTLGLILYRGPADHSLHFSWDEQQQQNFHKWLAGREEKAHLKTLYCTQAFVSYLQLLGGRLPDALRLFALLDGSHVEDPLTLSHLVSKELYDPFHLVLKGCPFTDQELGWDSFSQHGFISQKYPAQTKYPVKIAVVLPTQGGEPLRPAMHTLRERAIPYRVIPENLLTLEWDELDTLLYSPDELTPQGKRMLQGFCAAGGKAVPAHEYRL